jgi:transposase-like protein
LPINGQSCRRVEVLAGPERRRWSWEEKAEIVAESLAPDAVASAVARRYGLHPNQLYAWRKALRAAADEAATAGAAPLDFVPVITDQASARAGAIEIEAGGGFGYCPGRSRVVNAADAEGTDDQPPAACGFWRRSRSICRG